LPEVSKDLIFEDIFIAGAAVTKIEISSDKEMRSTMLSKRWNPLEYFPFILR